MTQVLVASLILLLASSCQGLQVKRQVNGKYKKCSCLNIFATQYYSALPVPAVYPNLGLALFNPNPAQPVGGLFVENALKTQIINSVSV